MNKTEASTLVTMLVTFYPGAYFDAGNAAAYEAAIADLNARETHEAIAGLVQASPKLPAVSDIRNEVFRLRKLEREKALPNRLPAGDGFPAPQQWGRQVDRMLSAAERYEAMARRWYESKGKKYPGDPGASIIDMVKAGARGDDISDGLRKVVNEQAVEEQDEIERRFP